MNKIKSPTVNKTKLKVETTCNGPHGPACEGP